MHIVIVPAQDFLGRVYCSTLLVVARRHLEKKRSKMTPPGSQTLVSTVALCCILSLFRALSLSLSLSLSRSLSLSLALSRALSLALSRSRSLSL